MMSIAGQSALTARSIARFTTTAHAATPSVLYTAPVSINVSPKMLLWKPIDWKLTMHQTLNLKTNLPEWHLDNSEQNLVAELGVYGCWILRHCISLHPEHPIGEAYKNYLAASGKTEEQTSELMLLKTIDAYCLNHPDQPVIQDYALALRDLLRNGRCSATTANVASATSPS